MTKAPLQNLWTAQIRIQTQKFKTVIQDEVKTIANEVHLYAETTILRHTLHITMMLLVSLWRTHSLNRKHVCMTMYVSASKFCF